MIRFKKRTAMLGRWRSSHYRRLHSKSNARGRAQARGHRRSNVGRPTGAIEVALERPGARAAAVHHRQTGAHRIRPAEHDACTCVAAYRRQFRRCRYRARGRSQWPNALGRQCRFPLALHHQGGRQHDHRDPGSPDRRSLAKAAGVRIGFRASSAAPVKEPSAPSIFVAAPMAPAG